MNYLLVFIGGGLGSTLPHHHHIVSPAFSENGLSDHTSISTSPVDR